MSAANIDYTGARIANIQSAVIYRQGYIIIGLYGSFLNFFTIGNENFFSGVI